jgi:hypothetical protein
MDVSDLARQAQLRRPTPVVPMAPAGVRVRPEPIRPAAPQPPPPQPAPVRRPSARPRRAPSRFRSSSRTLLCPASSCPTSKRRRRRPWKTAPPESVIACRA